MNDGRAAADEPAVEPAVDGADGNDGSDDEARAHRERLGATFAEGGARYASLRPAYPREAVAWGVGTTPCDVVDVGAGTGKLTEVMLGLGHHVVAVDPSEDMLGPLRSAYEQVEARVGTGEATGLPDACADVVTYAAAWHWVDPEAASREAARLLRPGGRLMLVWNVMDLRVPWVAGLNQTMHSMEGGYEPRSESAALVSRAAFGEGEHHDHPWGFETTARGLAGQVTTRSYYLALDADRRAELARRVAEYVEAHCGGLDERPVTVPHVCDVYRFPRL